jgi:hypothetical protein
MKGWNLPIQLFRHHAFSSLGIHDAPLRNPGVSGDPVEETLVYSDADIRLIICGMWQPDTCRRHWKERIYKIPSFTRHSYTQIAVSMAFRHLASLFMQTHALYGVSLCYWVLVVKLQQAYRPNTPPWLADMMPTPDLFRRSVSLPGCR